MLRLGFGLTSQMLDFFPQIYKVLLAQTERLKLEHMNRLDD